MMIRIGVALALCACAGAASAELVYGVTDNQSLVTWDSSSPNNLTSGVFLSGLANNERVLGIDFRPATGQMFALGSFSNLYTINVANGQASQVGSTFSPSINGSAFGFDFNPVIDRIRVVSEAGQNLVLNPNDGTATGVTPLFYGPADPNFGVTPNVTSSAYTNSFAGAVATQLYGIDSGLDILVTQANSAGTLGTVGPMGFNLTAVSGFDISGSTGVAYLSGVLAGQSQSTFFRVNLVTGALTALGQIDGGVVITAMTIAPVPAPGALALAGVGGLLCMGRRRR